MLCSYLIGYTHLFIIACSLCSMGIYMNSFKKKVILNSFFMKGLSWSE
jgi:hypothetical protein